MAKFVRRIVSGNKARFKDKDLGLELDLAYVTDRIIVMGFPAIGVEGFYRNRREDAKKFLDHRHGKEYWVFNFCPLHENSYPPTMFEGRVSRYPFPDHHAPPLAILPLFVREAREWLSGSPNRVAVLHCKAGKGRSGTLACAYLLSLNDASSSTAPQQSMAKQEWAKRRADLVAETIETEDDAEDLGEEMRSSQGKGEAMSVQESPDVNSAKMITSGTEVDSGRSLDGSSMLMPKPGQVLSMEPRKPRDISIEAKHTGTKPFTLEDILALHTARRMKSPSSPEKKFKQGVSIPSQRRWLYYWSLLLADAGPKGFWQGPLPRIRLHDIRVRMRDSGGIKMNLLKVANHLLEKTKPLKSGTYDYGQGPVWVSLARYDDELVRLLEQCERLTRSEDGDMGLMRRGLYGMSHGGELRDIFADGKWDKGKMVRSFARLGHLGGSSDKIRSEDEREITHILRPLTKGNWMNLKDGMKETTPEQPSGKETEPDLANLDRSAATSVSDLTQSDATDLGMVLDAAREVRVKFYLGQIFMGWFWFIPAFHMPPPHPSALSKGNLASSATTHLVLTRKEIDFPLGAGADLIDVDVAMEWFVPGPDALNNPLLEPTGQASGTSLEAEGGEPGHGIVAGMQAVVSDASGREAVETIEATDQ